MNTDQTDQTKILSYIAKTPDVSISRISKDVFGIVSPSAVLKDLISNMKESGILIEDDSTGYSTYTISSIGSSRLLDADSEDVDTAPQTVETDDGFSVSYGGEEIVLGATEALLLINGSTYAAVQSSQDVMACITEFASDEGMVNYVVKNKESGTDVGNINDIDVTAGETVDLEIRTHNKAAV